MGKERYLFQEQQALFLFSNRLITLVLRSPPSLLFSYIPPILIKITARPLPLYSSPNNEPPKTPIVPTLRNNPAQTPCLEHSCRCIIPHESTDLRPAQKPQQLKTYPVPGIQQSVHPISPTGTLPNHSRAHTNVRAPSEQSHNIFKTPSPSTLTQSTIHTNKTHFLSSHSTSSHYTLSHYTLSHYALSHYTLNHSTSSHSTSSRSTSSHLYFKSLYKSLY